MFSTKAQAPAKIRASLLFLRGYIPRWYTFQIGWLVLLLIVDSAAIVLKQTRLVRWGPFLLGGTILSILPAIATVLLRYSAYYQPDSSLALEHRNLVFAMSTLCVMALIVRLVKWNDLSPNFSPTVGCSIRYGTACVVTLHQPPRHIAEDMPAGSSVASLARSAISAASLRKPVRSPG